MDEKPSEHRQLWTALQQGLRQQKTRRSLQGISGFFMPCLPIKACDEVPAGTERAISFSIGVARAAVVS